MPNQVFTVMLKVRQQCNTDMDAVEMKHWMEHLFAGCDYGQVTVEVVKLDGAGDKKVKLTPEAAKYLVEQGGTAIAGDFRGPIYKEEDSRPRRAKGKTTTEQEFHPPEFSRRITAFWWLITSFVDTVGEPISHTMAYKCVKAQVPPGSEDGDVGRYSTSRMKEWAEQHGYTYSFKGKQ